MKTPEDTSKKAVHTLRWRQERSDLRYLLSLFAYDFSDHSVNSRLYLIYILVFVAIMGMMGLMYAAQGAGQLLLLLNPQEPVKAAMIISLSISLVFFLVQLVMGLRKSPLIFSEDDAQILAQQPVNSSYLSCRWIIKPWLESALLFVLLNLLVAFALAETRLPTTAIAQYLPTYFWIGVRFTFTLLPLHFIGFVGTIICGLIAMRKRKVIRYLLPGLFASVMAVTYFVFALKGEPESILLLPYGVGFGLGGGLLLCVIYLVMIAGLVLLLTSIAQNFNPLQAARETAFGHQIASLARFGRLEEVKELSTRKRLGLRRVTHFLPDWQGEKAFIWKLLLQTKRQLTFQEVWKYFIILLGALSLQLTILQGTAFLSAAFWSYAVMRLLTPPLRADLKQWATLRLLPQSLAEIASADALPRLIAIGFLSMVGAAVGGLLTRTNALFLMLVLPGMILSVVGFTYLDLFRKSRTDDLAAGIVEDWGLVGLLLSAVSAWLPLWLLSQPNLSKVLAFLVSLLLGLVAIYAAKQSANMVSKR
ncbi:MAG: hypothetical protein WBI14_03260 [Anaerolineaceae bacterium]